MDSFEQRRRDNLERNREMLRKMNLDRKEKKKGVKRKRQTENYVSRARPTNDGRGRMLRPRVRVDYRKLAGVDVNEDGERIEED